MNNDKFPRLFFCEEDSFSQIFEYANNACFSVASNQKMIEFSKIEEQYSDYLICRKSKALHRGYFCPSPIEDIIIGKTKRGILSNKNNKSGQFYKYYFDANGHIAIVLAYYNGELKHFENLINFGDRAYGVEYHQGIDLCFNEISTFSECIYNKNNQIVQYTYCLLNPIMNCVMEITQECYFYVDKKLTESERTYLIATSAASQRSYTKFLCSKDKYFYKSENGKLCEYVIFNKRRRDCYSVLLERNADEFTYRDQFNMNK